MDFFSEINKHVDPNSVGRKKSQKFRIKICSFKIIYLMTSTFFFTDFLCNHLSLGHCAHEQNQVYETGDALSLDSPNTDC